MRLQSRSVTSILAFGKRTAEGLGRFALAPGIRDTRIRLAKSVDDGARPEEIRWTR